MRASEGRARARYSTGQRWLTLPLSLGLATLVAGATWVVTTTDDAGPGSLRDAMALANATPGADQITFDPSLAGQTVNLTSGELAITDEVTIDGLGAGQLTVRRHSGAASHFRVFDVDDGAPGEIAVTLRNLTIAGGYLESDTEAVGGGGIRSAENLALEGCVVRDNEVHAQGTLASMGGGVYSSGPLTVTGCTLIANEARSSGCSESCDARGGGVYSSGDLSITHSLVTQNSAYCSSWQHSEVEGGGVYSSGSLLVRSSTISLNEIAGEYNGVHLRGGGIAGSGALEIRSSTIASNRAIASDYNADVHGCGVFGAGSLTVARSAFFGNRCEAEGECGDLSGGALEGNGQVWNSTFFGNSADCAGVLLCNVFGGALYGGLGVYNSTIAGNSVIADNHGAGGGFYASSGARLVSTIVSGNSVGGSPAAGPDLFQQGVWQLAHHNLVGDPADSAIAIGEEGNITGDPELGPLQANGGPTLTCAIPLSSPAIDTGSNPLALIADQRGYQPRDAYGATDIGAYEHGAVALAGLLFADSFELGDTSGWSAAVP